MFVTVMWTPGTAAPDASVMTPEIEPRVSCAHDGTDRTTKTRKSPKTERFMEITSEQTEFSPGLYQGRSWASICQNSYGPEGYTGTYGGGTIPRSIAWTAAWVRFATPSFARMWLT